ncbi:MAG TPA: hypothetical protein VHD36_11410 [Pirellulales bacterium]|nr:hypothetical protein [Pirellulales bacterium]
MTQHEHRGGKPEHGHEHGHSHEHGHRKRPIHHDWRLWVAVIAMLGAMLAYVMSDDERFAPGNDKHDPMPAAPAPAM